METGRADGARGDATADGRPGSTTLLASSELAELVTGDRPLAVEFGQFASACTLLLEELGGQPYGAPSEWRRAATSKLDSRDVAALRPFLSSAPREIPSSLCVLPHRTQIGFPSLEEDLERIVSIPPEALVAQLPSDGHWDAVARAPRPWLEAFARALRRACEGLQEAWKGAAGLLEREAERIGVAAVRGAERELVSTRFSPGMFKLEAERPDGSELEGRLGLVPLLAGPRAGHAWLIDGELTHIAYPISDAWRLLDGGAPPPAALDALLGPQRALIIRLLDRPRTAGELAEALIAVPSAASHHLGVLEQAGLVVRERRGRHVLARRTARGSEIVTLYEEG